MPAARLLLTAALVATTALATVAVAQPRARPPRLTTFSQPFVHEQCQDTWAFMCNIPLASGGHYGTAKPMRACTRHDFASDGTVAVSQFGPVTRGRYFIVGERIIIETRDDDGTRQRYELPLTEQARALLPGR